MVILQCLILCTPPSLFFLPKPEQMFLLVLGPGQALLETEVGFN